MDRIEAELLIPGHGEPVRGGVVVLDGPRISYAGPAGTAPPTPGIPVSRAAAVVPGMWDDPLADIGVLADPDHVTGVWTRGRRVKEAP